MLWTLLPDRLRYALAMLAAASTLAVAVVAWQYQENQSIVADRADALARDVAGRVEARMRTYEYGLRGARGAIVAAGVDRVSRQDFERYALTRDIKREFPGARGFGFIRRVARSDEAQFLAAARRDGASAFKLRQFAPHEGERFVIQYIEPQGVNSPAVGLDIASEPNRREAAVRAMHEARAILTEPITLVQALGKRQQSFLLLIPVYKGSAPPDSAAERESATVGWAYAPLSTDEVLSELLSERSDYHIKLRDVSSPARHGEPSPFFSSAAALGESLANLTRRLPLDVYGRRWEAEVTPKPAFVTALKLRSPAEVAAEAALVVALMTALAWFFGQAKSRRRAMLAEQSERAAMVEAAVDAFVGVSLDGRITSWNAAAQNMFGYRAEEAMGRPVDELLIPAERASEAATMIERIHRGLPTPTYDTTRRTHDGRELEVAISMAPLRDGEGRIVGMVKTMRDISAAKVAERALQKLTSELERMVAERTASLEEAQRDLRNILDALPSMVGYWDRDLRNRFANRAYRDWFGERGAALEGKTMRDLLGPELFEKNRAHVEAALRGEAQSFERSIPRPDGPGERHSLAHYLPDMVNGEVLGFYVLVHDVTELTQSRKAVAEALRDKEFLLDTIHKHAIMSVTDPVGRIIDANEAFCAISGYGLDELVGKTHRIVNSGMQGPEFWPSVWRQITSGVAWRGEVCNRAKDGSLYWVDSIIAPFVDAKGRIDRYISIRFDITERKRATAELQATHARLALATDAAAIGVWEYDLASDILVWDERMFRLYGHDKRLGAQPYSLWADALHAEDAGPVQKLLREAIEGVRDFNTEFRIRWPGGDVRYIRALANVQRDAAGRPLRMVGVNWDITDLKLSALDLAATTSLLRSVLDSASEISIIATDEDFVIRVFNSGAEKLLGYSAAEVVGRATPGLIHDPSEIKSRARELGKAMGRKLRAGDYFREPGAHGIQQAWTYLRKDGERVPVSLVVTAMVGDAGKVLGYLGVAHDVSTQLQHERMLVDAKSAAERANRAKSEFLANMSHEIRTPMNAVIGLCYLLERTRLNAHQSELLGKMLHASETLLGIINDVLDLSKIEAGELSISPEPFSPQELVTYLTETWRMQAGLKGVEVKLHIPAPLPALVLGDSLRVNQILSNLLSNAIKFTDSGQVSVRALALPHAGGATRLRFEVQDTGVGIAPEAAERLFQPFAQADGSITRRFGGTGLGLSIVKQLAELMGGEVGFASELGVGSTFWAELPFELTDAAAMPAPEQHATAADPAALAGVRVLIVDDSEINLEVAKRILESVGAIVSLAANGREAIDHLHLQGGACDLVLMDVHMPVVDGLTATRLIRQDLGLRDLPIVALTAGALASQRQEARIVGMTDFISKPFKPVEVIDCIARLVRRPEMPPSAQMRVNDASGESEWPVIAGIDATDVKRRLEGDQALFRRLLSLLLDEFKALPVPGEDDVEMGTLAARIHKLRGSAGNLGAAEIQATATQAERACRHGEVKKAGTLLTNLNRQLNELSCAAEPFLQTTAVRGTARALDRNQLDELIVLLRQQHARAWQAFDDLAEPLRSHYGEERFAQLCAMVDQMRFGEAATLLEQGS